ncbi:hypothetical protein JCM10212_001469, partial [Sporobolomyces blumeae]
MPSPDALKTSLKNHNASFDALLRVIPAKYYLRPDSDDEDHLAKPTGPLTKKQKKALRKAKQDEALRAAKNEAARKARLARYDPDEPKTIAEIQAAKAAGKGKGPASSDDGADLDDDDDDGEWQDVPEGPGDAEEEGEDSPNETDFADSDDEVDGELLELNREGVIAKDKASGPAPTITELREKLQKKIADIQARKKQAAGGAGGAAVKKGTLATKASNGDGADDEEVAGSADEEDGAASVKSKDDLLEERKRRAALRDNRRKKRKEQRALEKSEGAKKRANEPSNGRKGGGKANAPAEEERPRKKVRADSPSYDDGNAALVPYSSAQADQSADPSQVAFSNLDFTSLTEKAADATLTPQQRKQMLKAAGAAKKNRHDLPKDANAALEILEKRKQRMDELDPEKREKAEDKERWEKVLLKAEGEKVRDDEKRLKKMAKRQEREKRKSAKAWSVVASGR